MSHAFSSRVVVVSTPRRFGFAMRERSGCPENHAIQ
jgi:hypothetical protein